MTLLRWTSDVAVGENCKRLFVVEANARRVPGALWLPAGQASRLPLVLVGHGGSQSKDASAVLDVAYPLLARGVAVVAIDGPVHGDRRSDQGQDGALVLQDFLELWQEKPGTAEMTADWQATLAALAELPQLDCQCLGWFGLSMGTAYGLPLCAAEPRIRVALLGMWGTSFPHGNLLMNAAQQVHCPVQFQRKLDDERFTSEGQEALFAALASQQKILMTYPGGHTNPVGEQLTDGLDFLCRKLLR